MHDDYDVLREEYLETLVQESLVDDVIPDFALGLLLSNFLGAVCQIFGHAAEI